jgi:hypothetical protein
MCKQVHAMSMFQRIDRSMVLNASQAAWPRTAGVAAGIGLFILVFLVLAHAWLSVMLDGVLLAWAWWMLHNSRQLYTFDGTTRELRIVKNHWLCWRPEPSAPKRQRTVGFERIKQIDVERVEFDEGEVNYRLGVRLTDDQNIYLATRHRKDELQATALLLQRFVRSPRGASAL